MSLADDRPPAREAGPELIVLQKFEEFAPWLLAHTGRWPKNVRFTLAQRVEQAVDRIREPCRIGIRGNCQAAAHEGVL